MLALVRQFQCQVCINHDLATDLTDCRTDPFAVLDSPRCGRAAAEEGLYSFEANENAGEMFVMDIPALDRSGAAPVEEY